MKRNLLLIVSLWVLPIISFIPVQTTQSIVGKVSWEDWKANCKWDLIPTYDYYYPDSTKINEIKNLMNNITVDSLKFVIFATTTCDECKENLPKLMKILEELNIPDNSIELYGLDDELKEPTGNYQKYNVNTTPMLFIKYKNKLVAEISYPYIWLDSLIEVFESLE